MGLIIALTASVLCAVVYVCMYWWEVPEPMDIKKAAVPPVLGLFAPLLSTMLLLLISWLGLSIARAPLREMISSVVIRSLVSGFLVAGLTEEIVKFLLFLLIIKFIKPKNVYESGMLCAGLGFGFTAVEEFIYGGSNFVFAVMRLPFFAMHMMFGLLMGTYLGLAKFSRQEGRNDERKQIFLALFLPILWHTLFDAATTTNAALSSEDHNTRMAGGAAAIVMLVVSVLLQIVLLYLFWKKREICCGMNLTYDEPEDKGKDGNTDRIDDNPAVLPKEEPVLFSRIIDSKAAQPFLKDPPEQEGKGE